MGDGLANLATVGLDGAWPITGCPGRGADLWRKVVLNVFRDLVLRMAPHGLPRSLPTAFVAVVVASLLLAACAPRTAAPAASSGGSSSSPAGGGADTIKVGVLHS